jgi:hypothetical protein
LSVGGEGRQKAIENFPERDYEPAPPVNTGILRRRIARSNFRRGNLTRLNAASKRQRHLSSRL